MSNPTVCCGEVELIHLLKAFLLPVIFWDSPSFLMENANIRQNSLIFLQEQGREPRQGPCCTSWRSVLTWNTFGFNKKGFISWQTEKRVFANSPCHALTAVAQQLQKGLLESKWNKNFPANVNYLGFSFSPKNILTCGLKELAVLSALNGKDNDCNEPLVLGQSLLWGQKIYII